MDEKKKAERWAKKHGFDVDLDAPRLPNGESARSERSEWIENSGGKLVDMGRVDDEDVDAVLGVDVLWKSRTVGQEKLAGHVERVLEEMRAQDVSLIHDRYYERMTLTDMAKRRRVSYQAVQAALKVAEQNFKREVMNLAQGQTAEG